MTTVSYTTCRDTTREDVADTRDARRSEQSNLTLEQHVVVDATSTSTNMTPR